MLALLIAGPIIAYVLPGLMLWRRWAAYRWAWTERNAELRAAWDGCNTAAWRKHHAAYKAHSATRPPGTLWGPHDSRSEVAFTTLLQSFAWPVLVAWWGFASASGGLAVFVTRPTRDERRRRQLATARENVARLERELGIGAGE